MGTGILLSVTASIIHATADAGRKGLTQRLSSLDALCGFVLFGLPMIALWWAATGFDGMPKPGFTLYALMSVVPNLFANFLFFEAVRVSPLSLTLPFLSFTPAFLVGTSYLINKELPSYLGACGIILILCGAFLLNVREFRKGAMGPVRAVLRERGSLIMLIVATMWSISAAADKAAVLRSGPVSFFFFWHVGMSIPLLVVLVARRRTRIMFSAVIPASSTAALHVLGGVTQLAAMTLIQASYVIAIKRAGMLLGILYGRLFFGETRLGQRMLGAAVMLLGVFCITLG
ncbi:MAG: DMT family transporter [Pseudomonadota bacterium]